MSSQDAQAWYRKARTLHREQRLAEARDAYLAVLRVDPDHVRALHSLGQLDLRAGKLADAERLVRRAIELTPRAPGFHNSLGNVLRARGDRDGAMRAYKAELAQRPDSAVTYHLLALTAIDAGNLTDALKMSQKAIFYAPKFIAAYNTMGRIYNNLGKLDAARQAFSRALVFEPNDAEARFSLGHLKRRSGDLDGAIEDFRSAIASDPKHSRAHRELGIALLSLQRAQEALDYFERALELDPNDAPAHFGMGLIFQERGMIEAATDSFKRAVTLNPENPDAHCNLAAALRSQGFFAEAMQHFRRALELQPDHNAALSGLANVLEMRGDYSDALALLEPHVGKDSTADLISVQATVLERLERRDDGITLLQDALESTNLSELNRMVLQFKLGDLLDHAARYDEAWQAFETGNAMKRKEYAPQKRATVVDALLQAWSADALATLPRSTCTSERPLFIVGMPRSGTSLVEQILASHPDVHGAGELNTIGFMALGLGVRLGSDKPYPYCLDALTQNALDALADEYLKRIVTLNATAARVTDKMWQNYENLGLIQLLFPNARIVHCMRDPRDSLLSCYFQLFGVGGVPFSYSAEHLVSAWTEYCRLMRHWRQVLNINMLEIRYEELVADPEISIRRLVKFAGLDWNPACLDFHLTRRAVTTASYHQVKQPMYRQSAGRHRNYEKIMDPRLRALEPLES